MSETEIENGKKGMSAETLYKISLAFDISADYLLTGKNQAATTTADLQKKIEAMPKVFHDLAIEIINDLVKASQKSKQ